MFRHASVVSTQIWEETRRARTAQTHNRRLQRVEDLMHAVSALAGLMPELATKPDPLSLQQLARLDSTAKLSLHSGLLEYVLLGLPLVVKLCQGTWLRFILYRPIEWFTTLLTEVWTSMLFSPIKAEYGLGNAVLTPLLLFELLAALILGLVVKSWLPLVWGAHGQKGSPDRTTGERRRLTGAQD